MIGLICMAIMYVETAQGKGNKQATQQELNAIYERVFGRKQEKLSSLMQVDTKVNGKAIGRISVQTDTEKITQFERNILLPQLKRYLRKKLYTKLASTTLKQEWLSNKELRGVGITTSYNIMGLVAEINISKRSMNRRMRTMLDALPGKYKAIPENLLEPAKLSAFVNLRSNISHQYKQKTNQTKFNLRAESAINVHGFVLENQYTFRFGQKSVSNRDYTRLVIDDPANNHRFKVGDINTKTRNFQHYFRLGGIQLSKESIWSSHHEVRPQGNYHFSVDSESEVEIYQDGKLTNTVTVKAGEHTLSEIRANKGNKIRLVIRDNFGQTRTETFNRFSDSRLLKPNYSQYAFSIGVPANRKNNGIHYNTKRKIASAFYQQGITEKLTLGLDAQTNGKSHQLGSDAIWATLIGNISSGISYTQPNGGKRGQAARFQLDSPQNPQRGIHRKPLTWNLSTQFFSKDYQTINTTTNRHSDNDQQRIKQQLNLSLSRSFTEKLHSSINITHTGYYDNNTSQSLGFSVSQRLSKKVNISIGSSYTKSVNGNSDHSIQVNLNVALGKNSSNRHRSINSRYNSRNKTMLSTYRLGAKGRMGKDSLSGSLKLQSKSGVHALGATMRYRGEKFNVTASHRPRINNKTNKVTQSSHANINTAIVFAEGDFALSKPVSDSFAILSEPVGLKYPMAVSKGKNLFRRDNNDLNRVPKRYDAVIKNNNLAVLNNLTSYHVQHLSVDSAVLPDGFDLNATEFDVMPDYKSGYNIKVGGEKLASFKAVLLDSNRKRLKLQGGQLIPLDNTNKSQKKIVFFSNENGLVDIPAIKKGIYQLDLFNYPYSKKIAVGDKKNNKINRVIIINTDEKK